MTIERELSDVIDQMVAVIPEGEAVLIGALRNEQAKLAYLAPEVRAHAWWKTRSVLEEFLGNPRDREWAQRVARIFSAKSADAGETP